MNFSPRVATLPKERPHLLVCNRLNPIRLSQVQLTAGHPTLNAMIHRLLICELILGGLKNEFKVFAVHFAACELKLWLV